MLRILDIGVSSSGLISAIKEALPPKDRHLVQYLRLKMIREHAINPLDTQLGNRYPLSSERSAKINILSQIATPVGSSAPSEDLPELIALVLDEAYKHFDDQSPTGQPKMYQRGLNLSIDAKIDEYGFNVEEVCWYELGDMFFDQGDTHYAHLAQKFAVPLLEDLNIIVRKSSIVDMWGEAQNGQLIGNFSRMIGAALRSYPILTQPTRFDIGDSRVVALDLDEAAPRGGGAAEKQTALVYMLARMILADDFYLTEDDLINFPKKYQSYNQKRIKTLRETPKKLVFDEFHRTASSPQVRNQVVVDIREGRKWGVHISLVSQLLGDFDKDMVDMATNIFFLGVNTSSAIQEAARIFGLTPAAQRVIRSKLNGPSRKGAPFLALMNLKDGVHEHLLYNTLGPQELWAFSTTPQDAALRNSLYKRVGPKRARVALARSYPDGSVVPEIEARLARLMESGMRDIDKSQIIEDLEKEILSMLE